MSEETGRVTCGTCGKTIKFPLEKAGKIAKCPNCGESLRLGAAPDPQVSTVPPLTPQPVRTAGDDLEAMATVLLAEQLPFVRAQLGHLSAQLHNGETVCVLAKGVYKDQQTLVAATNYRVIFIRTVMVLGKSIEDLPISKIGAIKSQTGILGGEIQIFSSGHDVTVSMVMPKQRAIDVAAFVSSQINGLPLPERPTYAMPAKAIPKAAAGGAAVLVVLLLLCSGCLGLSYLFGSPKEVSSVGPPATETKTNSPSSFVFVDSKTETTGHRNTMELYAVNGAADLSEFRELCRQKKSSSTAQAFTFLVLFDDEANAAFPASPFTAEYGLEEEKMRHIVAFYTYNRINGFSELAHYKPNMWEGKAVREKL